MGREYFLFSRFFTPFSASKYFSSFFFLSSSSSCDVLTETVVRRNPVQPESGSFAEYLVAKGDVQIKVPDNLSDEEAATLGISISTVVCFSLSPRRVLISP